MAWEVITDPQKGKFGGISFKGYATDPQWAAGVGKIYYSLPDFETPEQIDQYISSVAPDSPLVGRGGFIMTKAREGGYDVKTPLAVAQHESQFGTKGRAKRTLNPWNIGNDDTGRENYMATPEESIEAFHDWTQGKYNRTAKMAEKIGGSVPSVIDVDPEVFKKAKGAPSQDRDPVTGKTWKQLEDEFQPVPLGSTAPGQNIVDVSPDIFAKAKGPATTDATSETLAQFAGPAGEMVGEAIDLPMKPVRFALEKFYDSVIEPQRERTQKEFVETPEEAKRGAPEAFAGLPDKTAFVETMTQAMVPIVYGKLGQGLGALGKLAERGVYKYGPDFLFKPTAEGGLPAIAQEFTEGVMARINPETRARLMAERIMPETPVGATPVTPPVEAKPGVTPPKAEVAPESPPAPQSEAPWKFTDKQFKEQVWSNYPKTVLLPSEYKQIAKNEGQQARDLVYELNLKGIDTIDTHSTPENIVIQIPKGDSTKIQDFVSGYDVKIRSEKTGDYLEIPLSPQAEAAVEKSVHSLTEIANMPLEEVLANQKMVKDFKQRVLRHPDTGEIIGTWNKYFNYREGIESVLNTLKKGVPAETIPQAEAVMPAVAGKAGIEEGFKPYAQRVIEGYRTEGLKGKFFQRGHGTYIALDEPFQAEGGTVKRVSIDISPEKIFDPNGLIPGTNLKESKIAHEAVVNRLNDEAYQRRLTRQAGRESPEPDQKQFAKDRTRILKDMGFEAEAGWIDGPEGKNRELVVFDKTRVKEKAVEAPPAPQSEAVAEGKKAWEVLRVPIKDIKVDPGTFQFKQGYETETGAGLALKDVRKWDEGLGGVVTLWRDSDGQLYVVNGHQRLALAKRLGVKDVRTQVLDSANWNSKEARAYGAKINIAEGRGTELDMAKFLRDTNLTAQDLANEGLSLSEAKTDRAIALSQLIDPIFQQTIFGRFSVEKAITIGRELAGDEAGQSGIYKLIHNWEKQGKIINNDRLKELIRLTVNAPRTPGKQIDLFGEKELMNSLIMEKADILTYSRKSLLQDRGLFNLVSKKTGRLKEAGNVIEPETNKLISRESADALALLDKFAYIPDSSTNKVLNEYAVKLSESENKGTIRNEAYKNIKNALSEDRTRFFPGQSGYRGITEKEPQVGTTPSRESTRPGEVQAPAVKTPKVTPAEIQRVYPDISPEQAQILAQNPELRKQVAKGNWEALARQKGQGQVSDIGAQKGLEGIGTGLLSTSFRPAVPPKARGGVEEKARLPRVEGVTEPSLRAAPDLTPEQPSPVSAKDSWKMTLSEILKENPYGYPRPMFSEESIKATEDAGGKVSAKLMKEANQRAIKDIKDTHKKYVELALAEGKPVLPSVLADYPDLAKKYGKGEVPAGEKKGILGDESGAVSLGLLTKPAKAVIEDTAKLLKDAPEQIRSAGEIIKDSAQKLWNWYKHPFETKERGYRKIVNEYLGESQVAGHENAKYIKAVIKAVPDVVKRRAITRWIQAGGDEALLRQWADNSKGEFKKIYESAIRLTPEEVNLAKEIAAKYEYYFQEAQGAGILEHGLENYVNQLDKRTKHNKSEVRKLQAEVNAGLLNTNFKYAKERIFGSYFEREQAGREAVSDDIAFLLGHYHQSMYEAINARRTIKSLTDGNAADGRPLVSVSGAGKQISKPGEQVPFEKAPGEYDMTEPKGPDAYLIRPRAKSEETADYRYINHPALRKWKWVENDPIGAPILLQGDMYVHPDIYRHLKNVLGKSAVREYAVGRVALKVSQNLKGVLLSGLPSGFHQVHLGSHAIFHEINPFTCPEINFKDPIQVKLVKNGLMVYNHNALAQFSEGLHSTGLAAKVPGVGRVTQAYGEYLFQDLIPRYKMKLGVAAYERNLKRYEGKYNDAQIAEISANQGNAAFGELNYKAMGRNPTIQDMFRLLALAPDFLEARGRFAGQALKPGGREQQAAMLRAVIGMYGAGIIGNMLLSDDHKPHWDKPFTLIVGKTEYSLRSIPGDFIHLVSDPRSFVYHRLNPTIMKPLIEFVTSRDVFGRKRNWEEQIGDFFRGHVPIPAQGLVSKGERTLLQSALQSIGVSSWEHKTDTDKIMRDYYVEQARLNKGETELDVIRKDVRKLFKEGKKEEGIQKVKEVVQASKMDPNKAVDWLLDLQKEPKQAKFQRLPLDWQLKAIMKAEPEERRVYEPLLIDKIYKAKPFKLKELEPEIKKYIQLKQKEGVAAR